MCFRHGNGRKQNTLADQKPEIDVNHRERRHRAANDVDSTQAPLQRKYQGNIIERKHLRYQTPYDGNIKALAFLRIESIQREIKMYHKVFAFVEPKNRGQKMTQSSGVKFVL